jgi:hypothetical protein
MKIHVPHWIAEIKDIDIALFAWFCHRISRHHGWGVTYTIHKDDVGRICNKRADGLRDFINKQPTFAKHVEVGELLDTVMIFSMQEPKGTSMRKGRPYGDDAAEMELKTERQKMIYIYLLGCLNSNLLVEDSYNLTGWHCNAHSIKEFRIDREAQHYIKKRDRQCEDES